MKKTFGTPLILPLDRPAAALERVPLDSKAFDENWLQKLIFDHPTLVPVHAIEPGFGEPVAIAREIACGHGFIDNLYLTPTGDIVLVETKLWRNPQARREVVAQTLDYIAALTAMDYAALERAVLQAQRSEHAPLTLHGHMSGRGDAAEEAAFIDAVALNLRRGRVLAIVIGDGIRQEAETLANLLQSHAGAHFTFALVELAMWRDPGGAMIVMPSTLVQTVMIERGIVVLSDDRIKVVDAPARVAAKPHSITEAMFFEALARVEPALPDLLRDFLSRIEPLGVYPDYLASLNLKADVGNLTKPINLGYITKGGKLWTSTLAPGLGDDVALAYNHHLAALFGGQVVTSNGIYITTNGKSAPSIKLLLPQHRDAWVEQVRAVLAEARRMGEEA